MALIDLVESFFKAHGSSVEKKDATMLVAERQMIADEIERTCVWVLTKDERKDRDIRIVEEDYKNRFMGMIKKSPGAKLHLLVDTTENLTSEFRNKASSEFRVRIQVPSQFFDMPFSWEVAKAAASATKDLSDNAQKADAKRVPQAFIERSSRQEDEDLVSYLVEELDESLVNPNPFIWLIVAPAGQGKSVCFSSLFWKTLTKFQENKRRYNLFPRPLPLVSGHLKDAAGPTVLGLIEAFIRTEFAAHARPEYFNWLIDNRFGILMLDGLDELLTRDTKFLEYLEDRITSPGSKPAIIISMRDSLFDTSEDLSAFINDYNQYAKIFALKPWENRAKRIHAWINLEGRQPKKEDKDTQIVASYLSWVNKNETIKRLSSTPFYADLIIHKDIQERIGEAFLEQDIIALAIENMCRREYEKGLLDKEIFPHAAFQEWLEEIAIIYYQSGGISVQELRELADLAAVLATRDLEAEEHQKLMDQITMAPFFRKSDTSGRLELTHELIAEFLAGNKFIKYFRTDPPKFIYYLGQRDWPSDSILFSILAHELQSGLDKLVELASAEGQSQIGMRNLIQLVVRISGGCKAIKDKKILLGGAKLQGVLFTDADFSGVSFRSTDLTNTQIVRCDLKDALFEGAVFKKTVFEKISEKGLLSAKFGDCEHFESVIVDGRMIDDYDKFRRWITEKTGIKDKDGGLCPSSRQMLFLFRKFIFADGQGRRDILDRRGVLRGKKEPSAASMDECLQAAINFGYLLEEHGQRIKRATGTKYGEMVTFVKNQKASPDIRSLLDTLCRVPKCAHVPPVK